MGKTGNQAKRAAAAARAAAARAELAAAEEEGAEATGEDVTADTATAGCPLFTDDLPDTVLRIDVTRHEPIQSGLIGWMPPSTDEEAIKRRFGGGTYEVAARATNGRIIKRRTFPIAGDPIFESEEEQRRYAIKIGKLSPERAAAPAVGGPQQLGLAELMALMTAPMQHQMEMAKLQQQQQLQLADERRRQDQRDAEERLARERRDAEDRTTREREHHALLLRLVKEDSKSAAAAADPMSMITLLTKGIELGSGLAGTAAGGETNPVSAFISQLPMLFEKGKAMLTAGAQASAAHAAHVQQLQQAAAANGNGAPRAPLPPQGPRAAAPGPRPAPPPPPGAHPGPERKMVVTGATAEKLAQFARAMTARGLDPGANLEAAMEWMIKLAESGAEPVEVEVPAEEEKPAAPPAPAPPAPAPAPAPPTAPAPEPTPPPAVPAAAKRRGANATAAVDRATARE